MSYVLGVDLGTTYSAAAVHEHGLTQVVSLGHRAMVVPSVVFVGDEGVLVGEPAARRAALDPTRVAREFKRRIGDDVPILIGDAGFTPEQLTGMLLRELVGQVTVQQGRPPERTAVTFPANWGRYKQERMAAAIRMADIGPVTTITEPEAAAIWYASEERVAPGEHIAVYDLGGGTFDSAILRKRDDGFAVLGVPQGIDRLGGVDLDAAIVRHVCASIGREVEDMMDEPARLFAARLVAECVAAKEALSADTSATITVALPDLHEDILVTRSELEEMARPMLEQTVVSLERAIAVAGLRAPDVDRVLLVGGASRMPMVSQMVGDALARPSFIDAHPKHVVALGAALAPARPDSTVAGRPAPAPAPSTAAPRSSPAAAPPPPFPPAPEAPPPPPPTAPPAHQTTAPHSPAIEATARTTSDEPAAAPSPPTGYDPAAPATPAEPDASAADTDPAPARERPGPATAPPSPTPPRRTSRDGEPPAPARTGRTTGDSPRRRRRLGVVGAVLVVILAAGALAATVLDRSSSTESPDAATDAVEPLPGQPGGELVDVATFPRGMDDHIDPALATTLGGAQVANALYDTLTEVDASDPDDPQILPQVAESWEVTDGGSTWIFTVRDGLRFSDGEAVVPTSFVRGWERATDPASATSAASAFAYIDGGREKLAGTSPAISGVQADDDAMTLTVQLDHPNQGFDAVVALHLFAPMPSAVDRLDPQTAWEDTVMVGNGPFVLEAARSADRIVLARNPEWDGTRYDPGLRLPEQPYLERITFRASPDPDAAFDAFVAGDADVAGVSAAQQREARDRFSNTFDVPIFSTFHLQVGWHDPVVGGPDNVLLRRAILQAINRAEVNDEEFLGTATVADGITSPGIPGYEEGACDRCTHDPDAARADLADWTAEGNELDEPLRIQTGVAPGASDPAAAVIVADLAAVGIEAVEEPLGREFLPRLTEGACQLCLVATFPPYLSYDAVLSDGFHSDADPTRNLGAFTDGTFDRLIDDARATSSPTERADAFHAAEQRLLSEEVAAIPLVWFAHPYVYAADVAEFPVTNLGRVVWEAVSFDEG